MGRRIGGLLVGILMGALASAASAQSLAEVARQEAARREQVKASGTASERKVLTNADLPASAVVAPAGSPATPATAPEGEGGTDGPDKAAARVTPAAAAETLAANAPPREPADDEAGWRARAERVNTALAAARAQVRQLRALADRVSLEAQASDPTIAARAEAERPAIRAQILEAEAKEAAALADRQALDHEARAAGVPPPWVQ
jgi:hypothetical protein